MLSGETSFRVNIDNIKKSINQGVFFQGWDRVVLSRFWARMSLAHRKRWIAILFPPFHKFRYFHSFYEHGQLQLAMKRKKMSELHPQILYSGNKKSCYSLGKVHSKWSTTSDLDGNIAHSPHKTTSFHSPPQTKDFHIERSKTALLFHRKFFPCSMPQRSSVLTIIRAGHGGCIDATHENVHKKMQSKQLSPQIQEKKTIASKPIKYAHWGIWKGYWAFPSKISSRFTPRPERKSC